MQRFYKVQPYISQAYVVNGKLAVSRKLYQNKSYNLDFSFIFRNYKLLFLLSRENHCLSNQDKGICSKGACKRIRIIFDIESISLLQDIYLIFLRDLISLSTNDMVGQGSAYKFGDKIFKSESNFSYKKISNFDYSRTLLLMSLLVFIGLSLLSLPK